MTGSSHHKLSKWLASLLQPVLKRFATHFIRVSFTFADAIHNLKDSNNLFMCSFDISSLFTNVPLEETLTSVQMPSIAMTRMHNHLFLRLPN